jgi:hypothetical protein
MAEMNEEQARIRGYLQSQAAKLSPADLMAKVRADMVQLEDAVTAAGRVEATRRPSDRDWSANEVLAHIVDSSARVNSAILSAVEDGTKPAPLGDAITATAAVKSPHQWFEQLRDERDALFSRLERATGSEHLDVAWKHPMFGDLNWREWLLFMRIHDLDHARQLQGIVAALEA